MCTLNRETERWREAQRKEERKMDRLPDRQRQEGKRKGTRRKLEGEKVSGGERETFLVVAEFFFTLI